MLRLVLGGARSGKTAVAERLAAANGLEVVYIATAEAGDSEMRQRIERHRDNRPQNWQTVEEPLALAASLENNASQQRVLVVDCLTLWLSNCLHQGCWHEQRQRLLSTLPHLPGEVIMVSNETGLGVTPMGALSRQFVDESGWLHQAVAGLSDHVTLVVAGLTTQLK